jgi:hypothetical protein
MPLSISVAEPTPKQIAAAALPIVKRLKRRDAEYWEERAHGWLDHCRHGTFIGDPYGPDHMCWKCEDSLTVYDEAIAEAQVIVQRQLTAMTCLFKLDSLGIFTHTDALDELFDALSIRITQRLYPPFRV